VLRVFMLRRTKKEVEKFLPPKKEIHIFINMTNQQKLMYRNVLISKNVFADDTKSRLQNRLM
jgi:SWI/SNF-related matrix-associated actin-dependent regulator of chromatin subfamily A member 5